MEATLNSFMYVQDIIQPVLLAVLQQEGDVMF